MIRISNMFEQTVSWLHENNCLSSIYAKLHQLYEIQSFRIEQYEAQQMLKMYKALETKYNFTKELAIDPNNWNENQRKIFIWFMVCYVYKLEIEKQTLGNEHWELIAKSFFCKKPEFLHFQFLNILKARKRIHWTPEEDQILTLAVKQEKPGKWNEISKFIFFNSEKRIFKSPKHCRERWLNHLDDNKIHGGWTYREDYIIFKFVMQTGKRWSKIVPLLNETRTEHMIKNRFNSVISKTRTSKKQREEELIRKVLKIVIRQMQIEQGERREESQEQPAIAQDNQEAALQEQVQEREVVEEQVQQQEPEHQHQVEQVILQNEQNYNYNLPQNEMVYPFMSGNYVQQMPQYNMGCLYDYNPMMYMNQFYYQMSMMPNTYCGERLPPTSQSLLSNQSNFSPYGQKH